MKIQYFRIATTARWMGLLLVASAWLVTSRAMAVGSFTTVFNAPAGVSVELMILRSDGTVMVQNANVETDWYQLTPDGSGNYSNGGWTQLASMHYPRNAYGLELLRDGRLLVVGDENDGNGGTAEVYDPLANAWTVTAQATVGFADSETAMLPDGRVLTGPVGWLPHPAFITAIYDPVADSWSYPGSSLAYQNEASWVRLPDDSILTIDINATTTERYIPSLSQWVKDQDAPVAMFADGETGPAMLLPNGQAFYLGATGHTVLYTPSPLGGTNHGTWVQGPDIPAGRVACDAPCGMLVNGKVLCAVGPSARDGGSPSPTWFYEFDYTDHTASPYGTFHATSSPGNSTVGSSYGAGTGAFQFLALPSGHILCSTYGNQLYLYVPDTGPVAAGKPTISSITQNGDGSYHLTGTKLNGISAGGDFGDERQDASNYPIVQMTDGSGNVRYARTYNWSSTGVMTGSTPVTTEFSLTLPLLKNPGSYSLVVIANGISSAAVSFTVPVSTWVDFNYTGSVQNGSYANPFPTLAQGVTAVPSGLTILIKTAGHSLETMTISKPMTIRAYNGAATIGH
jgi:hypothetical protein